MAGSRGACGPAEHLIGESAHLRDLIVRAGHCPASPGGRNSRDPRRAPNSCTCAAAVGLGVGVAFDANCVGKIAEFLRELDEHILSVGIQFRTAAIEERSVRGFEQIDAQTFGVTVISMWSFSLSKLGTAFELFLEALL